MPSFSQSGDIKFVNIITGPRHVWLGLVVGAESGELLMAERPPIGGCRHGSWNRDRLRAAVDEGLAEAARRYGGPLFAHEIHYVANDTPSYDLVARCAFLIAERLAKGGDFTRPAAD